MHQNKNIQQDYQAQTQTKFYPYAQGQSQSRRVIVGENVRANNKRGCPPNKQIIGKDVSIQPKKPLQKILHFKAHFAGNSDNNNAIPVSNKINVTKLNNQNQYDLYHQVSQSQRVKFLRSNYLNRQTNIARPKANSNHQNLALKKFDTQINNVRSHQPSPINNKINRGIMNSQQNNQEIIIN